MLGTFSPLSYFPFPMLSQWRIFARASGTPSGGGDQNLIRPIESRDPHALKNHPPTSISSVTISDFKRDTAGGGELCLKIYNLDRGEALRDAQLR